MFWFMRFVFFWFRNGTCEILIYKMWEINRSLSGRWSSVERALSLAVLGKRRRSAFPVPSKCVVPSPCRLHHLFHHHHLSKPIAIERDNSSDQEHKHKQISKNTNNNHQFMPDPEDKPLNPPLWASKFESLFMIFF